MYAYTTRSFLSKKFFPSYMYNLCYQCSYTIILLVRHIKLNRTNCITDFVATYLRTYVGNTGWISSCDTPCNSSTYIYIWVFAGSYVIMKNNYNWINTQFWINNGYRQLLLVQMWILAVSDLNRLDWYYDDSITYLRTVDAFTAHYICSTMYDWWWIFSHIMHHFAQLIWLKYSRHYRPRYLSFPMMMS